MRQLRRRLTDRLAARRAPLRAPRSEGAHMTQPIRTLGALALGAAIVAIAALSVRTGPVSGAPASTDTDDPHDHGLGDRQDHGRARCGSRERRGDH